DWATVLALLKHRHPGWRMVSRVHGFDLFPERDPDGWIPFRSLHLEAMDRIYCVSRAGLETMERLHPPFADRFRLARLGTVDHGPGPWTPSDILRLVSCSNLVPLKRVDLLVRALGSVRLPVRWTHFGDGPERGALEAMAGTLPDHIRVVWKGAVPNHELITYYRQHPVDLFVHVSASEGGVPVALQEAASFGIPLLACDAGGVPELVDERTGVLLPMDVGPDSLAGAIVDAGTRLGGDAAFREGVRARWAGGFQAPVNFGHFCADLLDLTG
ncbi:MAG: glycosyltransferase, partial [Flavobacteriales bacterium]|nr:glycosyltransferase [Flavobacteriales bacterium]